jgi:3-oxoacyl-[acyl-carrier-protein] synthase-1
VFLALHAAIEALARGECSIALIGGLDSPVDPITLRSLADDNRILCPRNPDGLIPGEGAGFLLIASERAASASQASRVTSCALSVEPKPRGHRGPNVALGLSAVFRELRRHRHERVDTVISGQTGESGYERTFSYAYLRNATLMPEPLQAISIGAQIGDAGAAAGAIALIAAFAGLRPARSVVPQPPRYASALVYAESDDGLVGGCIIER